MLDIWIENHGTPELKRALAEGYEVKKGAATRLVELVAEDSVEGGLDLYEQAEWLEVKERTSPRAEAFAKRDMVMDAVKRVDKPDGWRVDVSRISRVALLGGTYFTGVTLEVREQHNKLLTRVALDFEGASGR